MEQSETLSFLKGGGLGDLRSGEISATSGRD